MCSQRGRTSSRQLVQHSAEITRIATGSVIGAMGTWDISLLVCTFARSGLVCSMPLTDTATSPPQRMNMHSPGSPSLMMTSFSANCNSTNVFARASRSFANKGDNMGTLPNASGAARWGGPLGHMPKAEARGPPECPSEMWALRAEIFERRMSTARSLCLARLRASESEPRMRSRG